MNKEFETKLKDFITPYQKPVQYIVMGLEELLKYQRNYFISSELFDIYIDSIKTQVINMLDSLKGSKII